MGTIVEFRLLVVDSLKYSSKAESPINRSAKAVISRNLTTSRHNHLFIYFVFLFLFFIFYFYFFHIFTENRHYRLICIAIATVVIGWPEWINISIYIYIHIYYTTKVQKYLIRYDFGMEILTWHVLKYWKTFFKIPLHYMLSPLFAQQHQ